VKTTETLAEFVSGLAYEALPEDVVALAKRQCIDLLGVALAGSLEPAGRIAAEFSTRFGSAPVATIWAGAATSPPEAAFANGVAAHVLDYDDFWLPGAHPTAPIMPAAFAVGEQLGASGRDFLAAMVAGYEVMGRLHAAVRGRVGWHPTGVFGTFGAVAACARLLGLDTRQTRLAFGIASSSTSGIDAHEGTMSKSFHAGQSARNGVASALLAASGYTASDSVFDSGRTFFAAFYRDVAVEQWRITDGLGSEFWLRTPGIGIKMQPAGYYMLQTFEAALKIVEEHDLAPDDVAAVEIGVRPGSRFDRAGVGGLEAKFSLQYMATMAIVDRALKIHSFDDGVFASDPVQRTLAKVTTRVDPAIPDNLSITYNPVTIRCHDGRSLTESVVLTRSHWRYPLERAAWVGKFEENAAFVLDRERVAAVLEAFDRLEEVNDVRELGSLLVRR
jgi:2-methylcitrate dehydratase PrpD